MTYELHMVCSEGKVHGNASSLKCTVYGSVSTSSAQAERTRRTFIVFGCMCAAETPSGCLRSCGVCEYATVAGREARGLCRWFVHVFRRLLFVYSKHVCLSRLIVDNKLTLPQSFGGFS